MKRLGSGVVEGAGRELARRQGGLGVGGVGELFGGLGHFGWGVPYFLVLTIGLFRSWVRFGGSGVVRVRVTWGWG